MKTRLLVLSVLILLAALPLSAQYRESRSLGIQFGSSSGSGYVMRWIGDTHGLQATLGASTYGSNDVKFPTTLWQDELEASGNTADYVRRGRRTSLTAGLNYIYILDQSPKTRFFIAMGGAYKIGREKQFTRRYNLSSGSYNQYVLDESVPELEETVNTDKWTVGAGPGFEFTLDRHFKFTIDLPITLSSDDEIIMYIPQVGLHYYFR